MSTETLHRRRAGRPSLQEAGAIDRKVLLSGLQAFRQHGFEGVQMEAVAAAAGVSKAALYRRHPNKAALLKAVAELLANEVDASAEINPSLPALEQIRQLMWIYHQRASLDERIALQQVIIANLPFHAPLREAVIRMRELYVAPVDRLLVSAMKEGALQLFPIPRMREYLFDLLVNGSPSLSLMGLPSEGDEEEIFAWRWQCFIRSIVVQP